MRELREEINNLKLENVSDIEMYQRFKSFKESKVILDGEFNSKVWKLSSEYEICNFHFDFNKDQYAEFGELIGLDFEIFIKDLKFYILCKMGVYSLTAFRQFIRDLKNMFAFPMDELKFYIEDNPLEHFYMIIEFLDSLPRKDNEEAFIYLKDSINKASIKSFDNRRPLALFDTYFAFGHIIEDYFKNSTNKEEKLFYFPLRFWWRVSTVIPMRPRETVLTPRDCLRKNGDFWYLKVRKDKQKGFHKEKGYCLELDYEFFEFQITKEFADEINWYLEETKDCAETELHTLFVTETHYNRWDRVAPYTSRFFSYINMNTCLRYFFEYIVKDYYGYTIVDQSKTFLKTNEIQEFNLGDTRHLSMIALIFSGAPAYVAKALAFHESTDISAHYYSNTGNFVETVAYRMFKQLPCGDNLSITPFKKPIRNEEYTPVKNGKCYSKKYPLKDFSDCIDKSGSNGKIGDCEGCYYYRTNGIVFANKKDDYKDKINSKAEILASIVNAVRKGKGYEEYITKELIEIRTLSDEFVQYLNETGGEGKWEDQ